MLLPFSTMFNVNEPTYFIEKVWKSIEDKSQFSKYWEDYKEKIGNYFEISPSIITAKIHTIREDKTNRWKAGMKIHPVVFNRSKNQFQFAPTMVCKWIQEIEITNFHGLYNTVLVDDRILEEREIKLLAKNDGFETVEDFYAWFDHDCIGKIIHWTNLKY